MVMNLKAIIYEKYSPSEVLKFTEVDAPYPKDNQVLVKVLLLGNLKHQFSPFLAYN